MPDIIRLRYVGPYDMIAPVFGPGHDGRGHAFNPGDVIDRPGKLIEDNPEADHFVVELGGVEEHRVFPRSMWALERGTTKKSKADAPAEAAEAEPERVEE